MLINEVENKVGLSKKSIRFYEEHNLIHPKRTEKEYRVYTEEDIQKLKLIKILRELGISINELEKLENKEIELKECINNRIKTIEKEEEQYNRAKQICLDIVNNDEVDLNNIDEYFNSINRLNKEGFTMKKINDEQRKKITGAIISSIIFGALFLFVAIMMVYGMIMDPIPIPIFIIIELIVLTPLISIIYNLVKRIEEIKGGEEDEASKY